MPKKTLKTPDWSEAPPEPGSYRAVFKYGSPEGFKHPNDRWVAMLKADLGLADNHFDEKTYEGREAVTLERPVGLSIGQVDRLAAIVGHENIDRDAFSRVRYSYGKTGEEMFELSRGQIREVADLVVHPRHKADVQAVVEYCHGEKIPVVVFSGGSSVTCLLYTSDAADERG